MRTYRYILLLLPFLAPALVSAQVGSLSPEVIATGGDHQTATLGSLGAVSISSTFGETFTTTITNTPGPFAVHTLTQGFHQPENAGNNFSVDMVVTNSSCTGANNGSVLFTPVTSTGPVTYSFNGSPFTNISLFPNLAPGTYPYTITDGNFTISESLSITEPNIDCGSLLTFYNGFTPNGDGSNDTWVIDGIEIYKENKVAIFNRWGDPVWQITNYNNSENVWNGTSSKGLMLPDATYFYVIEIEGKVYKGWVELTH
jgi:gliding motility-associated-like protein